MKNEEERRDPLLERLVHMISRAGAFAVAFAGSIFFHAYESTLDILPAGVERWNDLRREGRRTMAAVWHGNGLAALAYVQGQRLCLYASWGRNAAPPTWGQRALRDTALAIVDRLGYEVMDASRYASESRGVIQFLRNIERSGGAFIAPDGPSGPSGEAKHGTAFIAAKSNMVVVPIGSAMESSIQLEGWDHFEIPMPFSKVAVAFGDVIEVPHDAHDIEIEEFTRRIEASLNHAHRQAEEVLRQRRRKTPMTIHPLTTSSEIIRKG